VVVCNWLDEDHPGAHESFVGVTPSVERPLVLNLFGSLQVEGSVLLTERDYLDFVIRYSRSERSVPHVVERALVSSSLLFVGFDLDDWDFNVLLQGFVDQPGGDLDKELPHVAVQVAVKELWENKKEAALYLASLVSVRRPTEVIFQDLDSVMIQLGHSLGIG
jgi:hypothetical protein